MTAAIDFYFDFSSPYGYLAAQAIDDVGARHGIDVAWRPFLLGAVFKITGAQPLPHTPLKDKYAAIDMPRAARLLGVPFTVPEAFPFLSVAACRAYYWLAADDPACSRDFAKAVFHGAFGEGRDMSSPEAVIEEAAELGVDREALGAALQDPAVKGRLRNEVDAAIARGVFGSPFFFLDDEPFWGHDRLDQVDRWLETGGW
jgi:2-hydroxychromene-2-carboxylate isomerase